jgi:uncharacterized alpha-E superfamily protein
MLSRVAESIFWLSRYIERAENVARFVDVNSMLHLDQPGEDSDQWAPMVYTTGDYEYFAKKYGETTRRNVIRFLAFDEEYPNSIYSCLEKARECARCIREILPSELWNQVNGFYHTVRDAARQDNATDTAHDFFDLVKESSHHFVGLSVVTMPHTEGWHFMRLGRVIERADKTSRILDVKYYLLLPTAGHVGLTVDTVQWAALLRSASAFQAYRQQHGRIVPEQVVGYLVLDRDFPRSMRYCLELAETSLHAISGAGPGTYTNAAEKQCGRLLAELAYATTEEIIGQGLHEFLDDFQRKLNLVGEAIFDTFFAMKPVHFFRTPTPLRYLQS